METRCTRKQPPPSPHLERQLYDDFFPKEDEALAQRFHTVLWEERPAIVAAFKDRRFRKMGQVDLSRTPRSDGGGRPRAV